MYILMENVKGFEASGTRDLFVQMLKDEQYHFQVLLQIFIARYFI